MIRLNQAPGQYYLRFASVPVGDMQQVIEDQAIVSYDVGLGRGIRTRTGLTFQMDNVSGGNRTTTYDDASSVWMRVNGSAKPGAPELDAQQLAPFESKAPPQKSADVTRVFTINQTDVVTWVVDGYPYSEPKTPIVYGNVSDGWAAKTTLHMPYNSSIDIIMRIANESMDSVSQAIVSFPLLGSL